MWNTIKSWLSTKDVESENKDGSYLPGVKGITVSNNQFTLPTTGTYHVTTNYAIPTHVFGGGTVMANHRVSQLRMYLNVITPEDEAEALEELVRAFKDYPDLAAKLITALLKDQANREIEDALKED
jgi:hypothetical protein